MDVEKEAPPMLAFPRVGSYLFVLTCLFLTSTLKAESVQVRHPEGSAHAFLCVRSLAGATLATGDLVQSVRGSRVFSRLVFHFRDGSLDEESATFTQRRTFRLLTDHHIQRGPSFPQEVDTIIDAQTGEVRTRAKDGKSTRNHMDLPENTANGVLMSLLLNLASSSGEIKLPFLVASEKPRLVNLAIKPANGYQSFTVGGQHRRAIDYVIHVELGGIVGMLASFVGKEPADTHVWILQDSVAPAFIRAEGPLFNDGPIWRIEQISPAFSH